MGWCLWWVARTRISVIMISFDQGKCNLVWIRIPVIRVWVIKVNFDQGKCNLVWIRIPVMQVRVIQVQVTKKLGQIQGKWVGREFELSEFELLGYYCTHLLFPLGFNCPDHHLLLSFLFLFLQISKISI